MRKLLNTLYVTTPDSYLACDGSNVVIRIDNEVRFRIPVHNLEAIVCFGFAGASPGLMQLCCERGVALSFLNSYGKFLGRVTGKVSGNVLLRRTQYRWADDREISARLSGRFIAAKIMNSRALLHRALRDHSDVVNKEKIEHFMNRSIHLVRNLDKADNGDAIRGIEGEAAGLYFSNFNELIVQQQED